MAAEARPDPTKAGDFLRPRLTRLLERSSARLVTQTFYEAIRNYQLAVVDWTSLRPNVLFEVGVRLATSRRPPIHIIERDNGLQDLPAAGLTHTQNLIRLMSPIRYPLVGPEERCYERILERYLVPEESERNQAQLYEIVARSVGDVQDDAARSVVDELTASARSLADESETSGEKSVLFHDANAELATRYSEAAFERRIAAWLYIDRRYSFAEIRENRALRRRYTGGLADEILAARHLRERASALLDYIKARVAEFERDEA